MAIYVSMKSERHDAIRSLVSAEEIASQNELQRKLRRHGFDVTQATLSRDVHEMQLYKGPRGYSLPNDGDEDDEMPAMDGMFADFALSVRQAANQLVVRTITGGAQPVAASLDRERLPEVLGTIAGDDTVLIICEDRIYAGRLRIRLEGLLEA